MDGRPNGHLMLFSEIVEISISLLLRTSYSVKGMLAIAHGLRPD